MVDRDGAVDGVDGGAMALRIKAHEVVVVVSDIKVAGIVKGELVGRGQAEVAGGEGALGIEAKERAGAVAVMLAEEEVAGGVDGQGGEARDAGDDDGLHAGGERVADDLPVAVVVDVEVRGGAVERDEGGRGQAGDRKRGLYAGGGDLDYVVIALVTEKEVVGGIDGDAGGRGETGKWERH